MTGMCTSKPSFATACIYSKEHNKNATTDSENLKDPLNLKENKACLCNEIQDGSGCFVTIIIKEIVQHLGK